MGTRSGGQRCLPEDISYTTKYTLTPLTASCSVIVKYINKFSKGYSFKHDLIKWTTVYQVYLWSNNIIILEVAFFANLIKLFFHKLTEVIETTRKIHNLQKMMAEY